MVFRVQASGPGTTGEHDPRDESLGDCMGTAFRSETEDLLVNWNGTRVPVSYKYTLSELMDDLLLLLEAILGAPAGTHDARWVCCEFRGTWRVEWDAGRLGIVADWRVAPGRIEDVLNRRPTVELATADFLAEWKRPLAIVLDALERCGCTPERCDGLTRLRRVHDSIAGTGRLYR